MAIKKDLKDTEFIASVFDLSSRRIQQLSTSPENVLTPIKKGKNNYYDLIPTVQDYIAYLKDIISGKSSKQDNADKESNRLDAEIRYKNAKAERAELELKEITGHLHSSADVEAVTSELVFTIRGMLLAIPNRCSVDLANIEDTNETSEYLNKEVNQILDKLSTFQYNPNAYKERVQGRNKKRDSLDDEDEEQ